MAICSWGLLNEPFDDLTDWTDYDSGGGVSSIDPAGILRLDVTSPTVAGAYAQRYQNIGNIGTGDYTVSFKFKITDNGGTNAVNTSGLKFRINAGTNKIFIVFANGVTSPAGDGIFIHDGSAWNLVWSNTWTEGIWYEVYFQVHNSQTDVDIWVDNVKKVTDADCSFATGTDGDVDATGYGDTGALGTGDYSLDYLRINSGLCDPTEIFAGSLFSYPNIINEQEGMVGY